MNYEEWQTRWQLPDQAMLELASITQKTQEPESNHSENAVASECRLVMGQHGIISMRNNVGVLQDVNGRPVRYGLCNETPMMNKTLKSADDILIIPYIVKPWDVGRRLGIFGASEYKKRNWVYSGKGREPAQLNFHRMVHAAGGVSFFANSGQSVIDTLVSYGLLSS